MSQEGCSPLEVLDLLFHPDYDLTVRCLELVRLHLFHGQPNDVTYRVKIIALCHHHPDNVYPAFGIFGISTDKEFEEVESRINAFLSEHGVDWIVSESRKIDAPTWEQILSGKWDMTGAAAKELLERIKLGFRRQKVSIKCWCDNLETVFVRLSDSGEVLVSDGGKSFGYLNRGTDSTYRPVETLDMKEVESICHRNGVTLIIEDPDSLPRMECTVAPHASVTDAVERVAEAVDNFFEWARRNP